MTGEARPNRRPGFRAPAPWVCDVLLGFGVSLIVSLLISADVDHAGSDWWAHAWSVLLGALMVVRRRYPVIVVVLSVAAVIAYYAAGYPAIGVAVPVAAAVFSAAECGRARAATLAAALLVLTSIVYRLAAGQDPAYVLGFELPGHAILLAGAIALGDGVRSRRELRRQAGEIAELVAERYQREADEQVMSERLSIARELHESVGHALIVIKLHAEVAEEGAAADDDLAVRHALAVITETASRTFSDLRRTVAGLRRGGPPECSPPRVWNVESATRPAEQAGLDVQTRLRVRSELSPAVEAAVYRIVQESITNVVRHACASRVVVEIDEVDSTIRVRIANDGNAAPALVDHQGHGIRGMRERTHLLGGRFSAGPEQSGFCVRATIPLAMSA